ncbi:MAG: hypothetical protein ACRYGF_00310 [Janthinobacterium lividum]
MKLLSKTRRNIALGCVAFLCVATPSYALFGLGDIVFDPTNYAELITQATTAYSHYRAFMSNVEHFSFKQVWQTQVNQLEHVNFRNRFGETDGMDAALTTNNPGAAQAAWQNSTVQVDGAADTYLATQNPGSATRSQLAMIEAVDATSPACMNAVGAYRASVTANVDAEQQLQGTQMDGDDTTNSEVQQLNLLNASQAQHLVEQKQQGMLQACQAQQAAIANMQQRNAAANDLNTWGFVAQQRAMTNNNSAGSSTTWTTYLP